MLFDLKRRLVAVMIILAMIGFVVPVYAVSGTVMIELEDVTVAPVLEGEAKIKVKAKGISADVQVIELAFRIDGNMEYKSIQPLVESENVAASLVGKVEDDIFTLSVVYAKPVINLNNDEFTDVCTVVFGGNKESSVTLSLISGDDSWVNTSLSNADKIGAVMQGSKTVHAAKGTMQSTNAEVNLVMDKISTFRMAQDAKYGIEVSIESEDEEIPLSYKRQAELTDSATPTLAVKTEVPKGITYTVSVIGAGFTPVEKKGVSFDDGKLVIKNDELKPGDFDGDGDVDSSDETEFEKIKNADGYSLNADYDRDGDVDNNDAKVFDGIEDDTPATPNPPADPQPPAGESGNGNGSGSGSGSGGGFGGGIAYNPNQNSNNAKNFTDLGGYSWAESYIYKLKEKGIVNGTSQTTYSPANNIKRGDFILMLTKMLNIKTDSTDNFADVPANSYYASAIAAAKAAGIANGDGNNFHPTENITRQDLMVLAYRAFLMAGYIGETEDMTSLDSFTDKESISSYAKAPMAALVKAGIIQGSGGKLNPKGNATRAEVAVMCARLLDLMA